jgi:ssDNA-binding Zn-finger/Zn-ribbon topoisomerase 1
MILLDFKKYIFPVEENIFDFIEVKNTRLKPFREWFLENVNNVGSCPKCGKPMTIRKNRANNVEFLGCTGYPNCTHTAGYNPNVAKQIAAAPKQGVQQNPQQGVQRPNRWFYVDVIAKDDPRFKNLEKAAIKKRDESTWDCYVLLTGKIHIIPNDKLRSLFKPIIGTDGKQITAEYTPNIEELRSEDPNFKFNNVNVEKPVDNRMISDDLMSEEQRLIDAKFENMLKSGQDHLMINALSGTGKTTLLKHLAWKYGKAGQKWLYLVFNTKNKIEASEKFPAFVQVRTTNGFLGEVLGSKDNINKISKTDRLAVLEAKNRNEESEKKLEKARMLVDGQDFSNFMNSIKMTEAIPKHVRIDDDYQFNAVKGLLKSIRYNYKEQVLTLVGLAKSYALDPRNDEKLKEGFKKILSDYDFDTSLEEVQEKIAGWRDNFRAIILEILSDIFGTDFENIDFTQEIIQGATWLMKEGMPGVTLQKYKQQDKEHNLSDYRDFNDDLWYSATHAEDINWPKFDIVLVDEVQDFNEAQKIMIKKLIDKGAKIVAVGDPNQSLYRFRGADSKSFSNMESLLQSNSKDKNVTQKLTLNFRSRKNIIDFANSETHVKNLKGGKKFNDNNDGSVTKFEQAYGEVFSAMSSEQQEKGRVKETAFIARTNEPLIHAALKLLANNIKFVILGKDIAKDLIKQLGKVVFKFKLKDSDPTKELSNLINQYVDDEKEKHSGQSTKKAYLQELKEVCDAILATLSQFESERGGGNQYISIGEYKKWISIKLGGFNIEESEADYNAYKEKMKREKPVVLTTAHRSKGLEFERVYLLRYDQFPHKKAKREEDLEQEENARYVAITRAQDELHIIKLEGQPGYKGKQEDDAESSY